MVNPIRLTSACALALALLFTAVPSQPAAAGNQPVPRPQVAPTDAASPAVRLAVDGAKVGERIRVIVRVRDTRPPKQLPDTAVVGRAQARAELVADLQTNAAQSQQNALAYLAAPDVSAQYDNLRAFWIINGFSLRATPAVINALAMRPDVASIVLDEVVTLDRAPTVNTSSITETLRAEFEAALAAQNIGPAEIPIDLSVDASTPISFTREARIASLASRQPAPGQVTWGVSKIGADQVWKALNITGQGVVVANIDSGVDWQHPALLTRYRGYSGGPVADHVHNWFDATDEAAIYPSDANGHGTHTMGSIVGADGIGVAPGAKWMAVKGLSSDGSGLFSWLHSAFQFILAPNGDPSYAPDIVSNSWSSTASGNTEFRQDLAALRAAGILAVFATGNRGPQAGSVGAPASNPGVFSVGATDTEDDVAYFSSRGPSLLTNEVKPALVAPGVDIVSTFPGGGYKSLNGTSMSTPHVAGAAALLLSANPSLSISATLFALTSTAKTLSATIPNNISGWGRLDAYKAVLSVLQSGSLVGTVRDGAQPLAGATVIARDVLQNREARTVTLADGTYSLSVTDGQYTVEAGVFGYMTATSQPRFVTTGTVATVDIDLTYLPSGSVRGTVRDAVNGAYVTATVTALGTPKTVVSNNSCLPCRYTLDLPSGTYTLEVRAAGYYVQSRTVTLADNSLIDENFALQPMQRVAYVDSGAYYYASAAPLYHAAFDTLAIGYDEFRIKTPPQDTPTITDLLKYDTVIWSAPFDSPSLVGASDVLSRYLAAGKNLLLTGQDVALYDGGGVFAYPYYFSRLNAVYRGEGEAATVVTGTVGGPLDGKVLSFPPEQVDFRPDVVTQLRPEGGQFIGNYDTFANGSSGAGIWAWQCTKHRSAFYSFGLESLDSPDRIDVIDRTLQAFVAPRPALGIELVPLDPTFTSAAISQPGSVVTHVMRLRNTGDGGVTQTLTLSTNGNLWPSKLSNSTFTLGPCATALVTLTVNLPQSLGWNASDVISVTGVVAAAPSTRADISFTSKTPAGILLVDDDRFYNREQDYLSALAAQGNTADVWDTQWGVVVTHTPSSAFLQQYPVVVWFNGYDWYEPLNARDEKSLRTYLDGGGRLFLASQAALQIQGNSLLAKNYLGVAQVDYDHTITSATGIDGTPLGDGILGGSLEPFPYAWNLSSSVLPSYGTQVYLLNQDGLPAGVLRSDPGNGWRTVLAPFAFEAWPPEARADLMNRVVGWLSPLGRSNLVSDKRGVQPGDMVLFTLSLQADDLIKPPYSNIHPTAISLTLSPGLSLVSSTLPGPDNTWNGSVRNGDQLTWTIAARVEGAPAGAALSAVATFDAQDVGIRFVRSASVRVAVPTYVTEFVPARTPNWNQPVTMTLRVTNTSLTNSADTMITVTLPFSLPVRGLASLGESETASTQTAQSAQAEAQQIVWRGPLMMGQAVEIEFVTQLPPFDSKAVPVYFVPVQVADGVGGSKTTWLWLTPRTQRLNYPLVAKN